MRLLTRFLTTLAVITSVGSVSAQEAALSIADFDRVPPTWNIDSVTIAIADGSRIIVGDVSEPSAVKYEIESGNQVTELAWRPDGAAIAVGHANGTVSLWTVGQSIRTIGEPNNSVTALAWSPDGQTLVTGTDPDGGYGIYVWDTETGDLLAMFGASAPSLAYSPNGDFIAGGGSRVTIWDASTLEVIAQLSYPEATNNYMTTLAWSSDGQRLVTGSMDGSVLVWDIASAKEILFFEGSPAYQHSAAHSGAVAIPYAQLQYTWIRDVSFSADGEQVFSAAADGTVQAWDLTTGERVASATLDPLGAAAWNAADGRLAYLPPISGTTREEGAVPMIVSPFE